jgi:hypothetical protein
LKRIVRRRRALVSDRIQRRIERLLDEADEAVTRMDWQVVRDRATTVLALDPDNSDAQARTTTGKRAQLLQEYVGYINQLKRGRAGALRASEGESLATVRRRLGDAARLAGKDLVMKRKGDEVVFWEASRRPGRPRKR